MIYSSTQEMGQATSTVVQIKIEIYISTTPVEQHDPVLGASKYKDQHYLM